MSAIFFGILPSWFSLLLLLLLLGFPVKERPAVLVEEEPEALRPDKDMFFFTSLEAGDEFEIGGEGSVGLVEPVFDCWWLTDGVVCEFKSLTSFLTAGVET